MQRATAGAVFRLKAVPEALGCEPFVQKAKETHHEKLRYCCYWGRRDRS
jgi:hypothetical protein